MRAGTVVAANYLEMARLLGRSFVAAHPDARFTILLVDDLPVDVDEDRVDVVRLADLGFDEYQLDLMRTIYDVMELSTAVKPRFLRFLLEHDELACYIDPDIYVYRSFDDLIEPARTVGIVLTPHVLDPIPRDGLAPNERMIMQAGIFNLGFIAVGRPAAGFLDWWQDRLVVDAVNDIEANLFTDQRWIDWVPALFDHVVCRDPGMNIAWWNIHERRLERVDGELMANGRPVRFVHFSGYSPSRPDVFSKHQGPDTRTLHTGMIRELADEYGRRLLDSGHAERIRTPYQWSTSATGIPLIPAVRSTVRAAVLGGHRAGCEVGEFDTSVPLAFGPLASDLVAWLMAPSSDAFSRIEVALWESRDDLQRAFPDRDRADAERYRAWLDHDPGAAELVGVLRRPSAPPSRQPWRGAVRRLRAAVAALRA